MAEPAKGDFTLNDFRKQLRQLRKMGSMREIMASMPGMRDMSLEGEDAEDSLRRIEAMIDVMTDEERHSPDIIDQSRRERIARDSGTEPHEVTQLLAQFNQIREVMRQMAQMSLWQRIQLIFRFRKPIFPR
jgi:signal recognition particle subunit SRP54